MFKTILDKFSKKTLQLGLDIGTDRIKILQLSATPSGYRVENYSIAPVNSKSPSAIHVVMSKFATRSNIVIALSDTEVINKIINLPAALNADQIYDLIKTDAEQYFTQIKEELSFDFQILGNNSNDQLTVDILLIASYKSYITNQVNIAQSAGAIVKVVDVQSHAIERAFSLINTDPVHIVIDIGLCSLLVLVIENNNIIFNHSEKLLSITAASHSTLVASIQRALQVFYINQPLKNIQQLFLMGGLAHLPDFIELLAVHLKINVIVANPFLTMEVNSNLSLEDLYFYAPDLVLSCGLAIRCLQSNSLS